CCRFCDRCRVGGNVLCVHKPLKELARSVYILAVLADRSRPVAAGRNCFFCIVVYRIVGYAPLEVSVFCQCRDLPGTAQHGSACAVQELVCDRLNVCPSFCDHVCKICSCGNSFLAVYISVCGCTVFADIVFTCGEIHRLQRIGKTFAMVHDNVRAYIIVCGTFLCDLKSEEHTSELQSRFDLVCRLLLEKKK